MFDGRVESRQTLLVSNSTAFSDQTYHINLSAEETMTEQQIRQVTFYKSAL